MMEILSTSKFKKLLKPILKSTNITENKIDSILETFLENNNAPSLDFKHIDGCKTYKNLYQIRVTGDYRILFLLFEDYLELKFIGTHNEIKRHLKNC